MTTLAPVQIFSPEYFHNPYPAYAAMRAAAPVMFVEPLNMWLITGYDACIAARREPRFSSAFRTQPGNLPLDAIAAIRAGQDDTMLFLDPPDHTRLRSLVHKSFSPRIINELRGSIETILNELMGKVDGRTEFDLIQEIAYPMPLRVILNLIGLPVEDYPLLRDWAHKILIGTDVGSPEPLKLAANEAMLQFIDYMEEVIKHRRANLKDDMLSGLITAEEEGDKLTISEVIQTCSLLVIAGHETTTNLIANTTLALLRHPAQLEKLKHQPELWTNTIEEVLRYDSPVQTNPRIVTQEMEFFGQQMRPGQLVGIIVGAANHDPAEFDQPEVFDVTRAKVNHISFGFGIHFCIGAPLARMEAAIALPKIFRRWPNLRLTDQPLMYVPTPRVRALTALPLALE